MQEAPSHPNEPARIASLRGLNILDTPPEERFDRIIRTAQRLFDVPIALLSLTDTNRQWFKSCLGLEAAEAPRSIAFCAFAILQVETLVIPDTHRDPRFADNPLVTDAPFIRFYAGQPLLSAEGHPLGTLCILDQKPREFGAAELVALHDLALIAQNELNAVELNQALAARRRAEETFRAVYDNIPLGIYQSSLDGHMISANPALVHDINGYPSEEALLEAYRTRDIGQEWYVDPTRRDQFRRLMDEQGEVREFVSQIRQRDGTPIWVSESAKQLTDTAGVLYYQGTVADVTGQKETERALARERDLLAALMDNLPDTVYFKDTESRFIRINQAQVKVLGVRDEAEAIGKWDGDFQDPVLAEGFRQEEQRMMASGQPLLDRLEYNPLPDGTPRWFAATKVPFRNEAGEIVGTFGISRNITERMLAERALQQSEERFQRMVANVPGMVYQFQLHPDGTMSFPYISAGSRDIYGLAPEEIQADASLILRIVHPDDRAGFEQSIGASAASLQPWHWEGRVVLADGQTKWLEGKSRPERLPDGSILWDGLLFDITVRKQVAEQERYSAKLRVAADVAEQITTLQEPEPLLRRVVALLQERLDLYHVHVYLLDEAQQKLRMQVGSGEVGRQLREQDHAIPLNQKRSLVARAARSRETVLVADVADEPGFLPNPLLPHTRSEMAVPLVVRGALLGVLDVQDDQPRRFNQADVDIFGSLAGHIATALDNARLFEQVEQTLDEARIRLQVSQTLAAARTEQEVLDAMVQAASLFRDAQVNLVMADPQADEPTFVIRDSVSLDSGLASLPTGLRFPASATPRAMQHADTLFVTQNAFEDDRVDDATRAAMRLTGAISFATVRLVSGDEVLGSFTIGAGRPNYFDAAKLRLYTIVAEYGGSALREARLAEQVQRNLDETRARLAVSDALVHAQTVDEVLDAMIQQAGFYPDAQVTLSFVDPAAAETTFVIQRSASFDSGLHPFEPGARFAASQFPLIQLISPTSPFVSANTYQDARVNDASLALVRQLGIVSAAILPITAGQEWIGTVTVASAREGFFDPARLFLYQSLAEQGAVALREAQLVEQVQRNLRETRARLAVSDALRGAQSEDEVLDAIMAQATLYPQFSLSIGLRAPDGSLVTRRSASFDSGLMPIPAGTRHPVEAMPLVDTSFDTPFFTSNVADDERLLPPARAGMAAQGIRSLALVPMVVEGQVLGGFNLASPQPGAFDDPNALYFYRSLAAQASVGVHAARLRAATDAARAEAEQERTLLDNILNTLPVGVFVTDRAGQPLRTNAAAQAMLGRPLSGLADQPYTEALDLRRATDGTRYPEAELPRLRTLRDGQPHQADDLVAHHPDGREVNLLANSAPLRNRAGETIGATVVFSDITERRQSEAALRRSEQTLSLHIQHTPLAYIEWDLNFQAAAWNPAAEQIFGYSHDEAMGRHAAGLLVPESARPHVDRIWRDLLAQKGGTRSTNQNFRKDGTIIECEWYNTPLVDDQGTVIGVASLVQDVTARVQAEGALRESEARLRTVVTNADLVLFSIDAGGIFTLSEGRGLAALGLEPGQVVGLPACEVYKDFPPIVADIERALRGDAFTSEVSVGPLTFDTWYTPLLDAAGKPAGTIGVAINITERRQAEADREARARLVERQNAALLAASSDAALQQGDLDALLPALVQTLAQTMGVARASVWFYNEARDAIRCATLYELATDSHSSGIELREADFAPYFEAMREDRLIVADDAHRHPATRVFSESYLAPLGITSMLDAPIRWQGRTVGVLCHEHVGPPRHWTLDEQSFGGAIADLVARGLEARQRHQAELAVEQQRAFLRQVIDINPHLVFAKDREGRYTLANQATADIYAATPDQLLGRTDTEITNNPPEADHFRSDDLRVLDTLQELFIPEEPITDTAGRLRWLQTIKRPLLDATGQATQVLGVATDISQRKQAEAKLLRQTTLQLLRATVGRLLTESATLHEGLQATASALVEHLDAAFARIWLLDESGQLLELQASAGLYTHLDGAHGRVPVGKFKIGLIAQERRPHLTNSVVGDPRVGDQAWASREGMVAFAGYPLLLQDQLLGVIALFARQPLEQDTLDVLASVADLVALNVQRQRAEMERQRFTTQLRTAAEVATEINALLEPDALLREVVTRLQTQFDLYHVHAYLLDPDARSLEMRVGSGEVGRLLRERGHHIPLHQAQSLVARAARSREVVVVNDVRDEPGFLPNPLLPDTRSEVAVPLLLGEQVLGVLDVQDNQPGRFAPADLDVFRTLAGQIATALQNATLFEQSEQALAETQLRLQVNQALAEARSEAEVLDAIMAQASLYRNAQVVLYATDPHSADLRFVLHECWSLDSGLQPLPKGIEIVGDEFPMVQQLAEQGFFVSNNTATDERIAPPVAAIMRHVGVASVFNIAMRAGDEWQATLLVGSPEPDYFDDHKQRLYTILAERGAIALRGARLADEVKRTAERLRELDRLKSEFLANMSHELRTPLNSIIGYSELMLLGSNGALDHETVEDVQAIRDNGHHLLHLINDILDLAKIEAGRMALDPEPIHLGGLLHDLRVGHTTLLRHKPVEFEIEVEDGLPLLHADRVRLTQVLTNLVSNAAKFTDRGAIRLRAYRHGESVCIEVEDSGVGIAPEDLNVIFERFHQSDGSTTRRAEGTGLGLAITRSLVELHSGTIQVRSEPGQGSTFTIQLPLAAQAEAMALAAD